MAEINKGLIILLELLIAIGALIFLAGLYVGIFEQQNFPMTAETGVIFGGVLVLICGFTMAFYYSRGQKTHSSA